MKSFIFSSLCLCASILVLFWGGYGYGQTSNGDCALVQSRSPLSMRSSHQFAGELFPAGANVRATNNLRSYCCEQNILRNTATVQSCNPGDQPPNGYFPQSAYLFDHIVDIVLRRLDGDPSMIYPDVAVHPQAKERRDTMNDYAQNPMGTVPADVVSFINKHWNNTDPDTANLINLYNNVCTVAFDLYNSVLGSDGSPGAAATRRIAGGTWTFCHGFVQQRREQELLYARSIVQLSANQLLRQSLNTNLKTYFSNNRLMQLQSTIHEMVDAFVAVDRLVVEGTKICSM